MKEVENKEIAKQLKCVVLNGNVEKWLESEKAEIISEAVKRGDKFVQIDGELINTFSIVGIFNAKTMEEKTRRKNGEWQCEHGNWWQRGNSKCQCLSYDEKERRKKMVEQVFKNNPYIKTDASKN